VLARRIVQRARNANHERVARLFERRAHEAEEHGSLIRQLLLSGQKADMAEATVGND
jgi:hypothetical protein